MLIVPFVWLSREWVSRESLPRESLPRESLPRESLPRAPFPVDERNGVQFTDCCQIGEVRQFRIASITSRIRFGSVGFAMQ